MKIVLVGRMVSEKNHIMAKVSIRMCVNVFVCVNHELLNPIRSEQTGGHGVQLPH